MEAGSDRLVSILKRCAKRFCMDVRLCNRNKNACVGRGEKANKNKRPDRLQSLSQGNVRDDPGDACFE